MKNIDFDILSRCPLFIGVAATHLKILFDDLHFTLRRYEAGTTIANAGQEVTALMIVLSGSVRGEMSDFNGKVIKIEDIEAPRPLAVAFLFGTSACFPVHIVANNDAELLVIPRDQVVKMLQKNGLVLRHFMDNISSRAQFLSEKLRFLSFQSLKGKVAQYLSELMRNQGTLITLPMNQEELAGLMGVTRPSLSRTLRELNELGIIESRAKTIRIINAQALAELVREV